MFILSLLIVGPNTFQPIIFQRHQVESAIRGVALEGQLFRQGIVLSRIAQDPTVVDDPNEPLDPWNDIEYGPLDLESPKLVPILRRSDIDPDYQGSPFPSALADRHYLGGGGSKLCHSLQSDNYKSVFNLIHHLQVNCGKMDPVVVSVF